MASCGPSNPVQALGKHANRDASLQYDRVVPRPSGAPVGFRSARPDDSDAFHSFAANTSQPLHDFAGGPLGVPSSIPQVTSGPAQSEWADQFAGLSLGASSQRSPIAHQLPSNATASGSTLYPGPLGVTDTAHFAPRPFQPAFATGTLIQPSVGLASNSTIGLRPVPPPPTVAAEQWDRAFDAVERSTINERKEEPQMQEPVDEARDQHQSEDLRDAANDVLQVVSNETDIATATKMKQSKFLAFLEQVRAGEVQATDTGFVDSGGTTVDPHTSQSEVHLSPKHDTTNVGVPGVSTGMGPIVEPEQQSTESMNDLAPVESIPSESESSQAPLDAVEEWPELKYPQPKDQRPLEDPFEYLERLKRTTKQPVAGPVPSPLEEAQRLGPVPVSARDWEEHYEDAVWLGSGSTVEL